jgi:hypothetical protein
MQSGLAATTGGIEGTLEGWRKTARDWMITHLPAGSSGQHYLQGLEKESANTTGTGLGTAGAGGGAPIASSGTSDIPSLIAQEAVNRGVPVSLALALAKHESGMQEVWGSGKHKGETVTSSAGALGVMQLMPGTAKWLGVDPLNASENVTGGVKLLKQLLDYYKGDEAKALAAYDAGQSAVDKAIAKSSDQWLSLLKPETKDYVPAVLKMEQTIGQAASPGDAAIQSAPKTQYPLPLYPQPSPFTEATPADKPQASLDRSSWFPSQDSINASRDWSDRPLGSPVAYSAPNQFTVTVGDIKIMQPTADLRDIQQGVYEATMAALRDQVSIDLAGIPSMA